MRRQEIYVVLALALALFANKLSIAQQFQWVLAEKFSDNNVSESVGTDNTGNVYITGKYIPQSNSSPWGAVLAKYSSSGTLLWRDTVNRIKTIKSVTDASGNIYAVGNYHMSAKFKSGQVLFSSNPPYYYTGFIVCYDAAGNCMWAKNTADYGTALALMGSTGFCAANSDGFLAYYDNNGSIKWSQTVAASDYCIGKSVATDTQKNIYVAGQFYNTVTFGSGTNAATISTGTFFNNFIAKYDSNGVFKWVKKLECPYGAEPFCVAADKHNNCFVAGAFSYPLSTGANTYNPGTNGVESSIVLKFDSNGSELWSHIISSGTGTGLLAFDIKTDSQDNYYVSGAFGGPVDFGGTVMNGANDLFIAKYDISKNLQWVKQSVGIGGTYSPNANGMALNIDEAQNAVYISGRASNQLQFGTLNLNASAYGSALLTKLQNNNGVSTGFNNTGRQEAGQDFILYPNPSSGKFTIRYKTELLPFEMHVTNLLGETFYTETVKDGDGMYLRQIDLTKYAKGVYFIELIDDRRRSVKKMILD